MRSRHPVNLAIDISLANANTNTVKKALVTNRAHPPTHDNTTNGSSSQYKNNPLTPPGYRGHADLRSPGAARTPMNATSSSAWNFDSVDGEDSEEGRSDTNNNKGEGAGGEYAVALSAGGTATAVNSTTTTTAAAAANNNNNNSNVVVEEPLSPLADFITQTDRHGNASTPRSAESITAARKLHPSGPKPILHVDAKTGSLVETKSETKDTLDDDDEEEEDDHSEDALLKEGDVTTTTIHTSYDDPALMAAGATTGGGGAAAATADGMGGEDACDTLLDSFRMMCCCLLPDDGGASNNNADGQNNVNGSSGAPNGGKARGLGDYSTTTTDKVRVRRGSMPKQTSNNSSSTTTTASHPIGYSTRGHDAPLLLEQDSALCNNPNNIKLLPELHVEDVGKKCLVLDLDETLVHSSFRAVAGADFVIPVQVSVTTIVFIDDVCLWNAPSDGGCST
jgi:hypothetical protein